MKLSDLLILNRIMTYAPDFIFLTDVTQPNVKSDRCSVPLSFPRKRESMFLQIPASAGVTDA